MVRRRLPEDWAERYSTTPVLIKTLVETPRYTGAVYRASVDQGRHHSGPRALRPGQALRQAPQGHLASALATGLETLPQPLESRSVMVGRA